MERLYPWAVLWVSGPVLAVRISNRKARVVASFSLLAVSAVLLVLALPFDATQRLLASTVLLLFSVKGSVLLTYPQELVRKLGSGRILSFMSIWPGMDVRSFSKSQAPNSVSVAGFGTGLGRIYGSLALLLATAMLYSRLSPVTVGWLGIVGILLFLHFGVSEVLTSLVRLAGIPAEPLFREPLKSHSLREFWSLRWNLPYVEMNRRLFVPFLVRRFGGTAALVGVFVISGILHELAISYPAGAGYGGPMSYFVLQAILVLAEMKLRIRSRAFTWACILLPLPILFHVPFQAAFILPLLKWMHDVLSSHAVAWYLDKILWILGAAQFLVLFASYQVPKRLNWREELPRLCAFNQKLMYSYGGFIVLCIFSFGVLTLSLHDSFLAAERSASGLAIFMAAFWLLRLIVDFFYYKEEDWPKGPGLVIGHAMLNSLFVFLTLGYGSTAAYCVWARSR